MTKAATTKMAAELIHFHFRIGLDGSMSLSILLYRFPTGYHYDGRT
jgi:hypothetical protein